MRVVYKYPLEITDEQWVEWPSFTKPLAIQVQHGVPCIWADVETEQTPSRQRIVIRGTGHPVADHDDESGDGANLEYIGTFQVEGGALVFHAFFDTE